MQTKIPSRSARLLSLSLSLCALSALAQSKAPLSVPPIEDRNLYYSFFVYHQSLINTETAQKAATPANASQLDQQMATLLQVSVSELPFVVSNTQNATARYTALAAQPAPNPNAPVKAGQPNAAQTAAEQLLQRDHVTVDGVRLLFFGLSTASWTGLHSYITGTYKNTIYKP
jgi:hypothetical protein